MLTLFDAATGKRHLSLSGISELEFKKAKTKKKYERG